MKNGGKIKVCKALRTMARTMNIKNSLCPKCLRDVARDKAEHEMYPLIMQGRPRTSSRLLQCHTLLGQFLFCFLVLSQVHQPHATQYIGRLGELNIIVTDNLYSVAPGVPKIKERSLK